MQVTSSKNNSLQLDADQSQSSFSFAVSPSQKPLFLQSVYLSMLTRHLVSTWESKVVHINSPEDNSGPGNPTED